LLGETRLVAAVNATAYAAMTWGNGPPSTIGQPLSHLFRKLVGAKNRPTARSTKGLMRGRRKDCGENNRTLAAHKDTSSDRPGEVRRFYSGEYGVRYAESPKIKYSLA
jgi:hypothetical protein